MKESSDDWTDKQQEEIDLRLENQSLETEITLNGGTHWKSDEVTPQIENAFLKNVLAFEEASEEPEVPIRSFFPEEHVFPPAESMSPQELSAKLDEIAEILSTHDVEFGFANPLPDMLLYKHLTEDVIPNDTISPAIGAGGKWFLDGCTGACDDCFQKQYCSVAAEIQDEQD
jgi:hypothetical protein